MCAVDVHLHVSCEVKLTHCVIIRSRSSALQALQLSPSAEASHVILPIDLSTVM